MSRLQRRQAAARTTLPPRVPDGPKRILLLPGLGDVHWVLLKLQAWLAREGPEWENPEVWLWDIDSRPRTLDYLEFVPWVRRGDYYRSSIHECKGTFDSLYMEAGSRDVLYEFQGFDAFIGTNGNMRNGVPFAKVMGGAAINYAYGPVGIPDEFGRAQRAKGPYVVMCFSGHGMFGQDWAQGMPPAKIRDLVARLKARHPGHRFIFTGCSWDDEHTRKCLVPGDESIVGETKLPDFLSLLKHADGYVGWCGGNAILAQHLGVPTVAWWSDRYFPKHDRTQWETPHDGRSRQLVLEVEDYDPKLTPLKVMAHLEVFRGKS